MCNFIDKDKSFKKKIRILVFNMIMISKKG